MLTNMTEEEWDAVINVHLKGTFAPSRWAAAYWREQAKAGQAGRRPHHQHHVGVGHLRQRRARPTTARPRPASPRSPTSPRSSWRATASPSTPSPRSRSTRMTEGLGPAPETDEEREARSPALDRADRHLAGVRGVGRRHRPGVRGVGPDAGRRRGLGPRPVDRPDRRPDQARPGRRRPARQGPRRTRAWTASTGSLAADHAHALTTRSVNVCVPRAQAVRRYTAASHVARPIHRRNPMPLNPDAVGAKSEPVETSWTSKDACSTPSASVPARDELAFTTENTNGVDQHVFPTFPVVIGWGRGTAMGNIGTFNPAMLVHGQQAVTLHRPIPVAGTATLTSEITGIYDKGKAAVVVTDDRGRAWTASRCTPTRMSAFIRGEGGWGGDRGPSGPAERAARARSRPRRHVPDVARPGAGVPAVGRPQPAAHRPVVRRDGRLRPADPARPVHATASPAGRCCTRCAAAIPRGFHHIEGRFAVTGDARATR